MLNNIELLAPVGSFEALKAAVKNGADAVYLGGKLFNARQYASNFDYDELKEAVKYAHLHKVKVFVTLNILLNNKEIEEVIDYINYLYDIDVDAVIVQDLGLVKILRSIFPNFEIHASTQMTINNYMGVRFLEDLGFNRVVLSREVSKNEISEIKNKTEIELEGFIHGALCVSYSGQCLMSSIIGGRSGNRGRCAQTCRMPYTAVNINDRSMINQKLSNKYLLSPKDLNTIDDLKKIIDAGISSLKIEGRMKRAEYVAIIVENYRKKLNQLFGETNKGLTVTEKREITQIFNRGFTKGFILNESYRDFISYDKPNNRGILIGKVTDKSKTGIRILLNEKLRKGDGIEFLSHDGNSVGLLVDNIYINNRPIDTAEDKDKIEIRTNKNIELNSRVFKTSDIELLNKARATYDTKDEKNVGLYMSVDITKNEKLKLIIWDDEYNVIEVHSDFKAEEALKINLTKEKVEKQFRKLGNTQFYILDININITENTSVPISVLNDLRRKGIEDYTKKVCNFSNREKLNSDYISLKSKELFNFTNKTRSKRKISVKINNIEQLYRLDINKLDKIYLNFKENLKDAVKELSKFDKEIYICSEKILSNTDLLEYLQMINEMKDYKINGYSVSNLGTLKLIKDNTEQNIHCDVGINVFNNMSIKLLKEYGANSITLSPELNLKQIKDICKKSDLDTEVIGYGYLPLMSTKYCPFSYDKKCNDKTDCSKCNMSEGVGLLDRKNMVFKTLRRNNVTTIYNSLPIVILEHLNNVYNSFVDYIRLDFTFEKDEISEIQDMYYKYSQNLINEDEIKNYITKLRDNNGITKGHFYRGVM